MRANGEAHVESFGWKGPRLGGFGSLEPSLNFARRRRKCQRLAEVPMVVFEAKRTEPERVWLRLPAPATCRREHRVRDTGAG